MSDYSGHFEIHITVRAADGDATESFREWCRAQGLKCVRIVLSRGKHVEQPMATYRRSDTSLRMVRAEAVRFARLIEQVGLPVVRVKVEAAPQNADVPQADAEAAAHAEKNYFEHHIKLLRDAYASRERLAAVCEQHAAHLSHNAFREAEGGKKERFVTLRSYGVGRATSQQQLEALLAALAELGEHVIEHESEYCVYDSNLALDAGWLPESV